MEEMSTTEIMKLDLDTAYKLFVQLQHEDITNETPYTRKEYNEAYIEIRFGIELNFDIYTIINEHYTPKIKGGKLIIDDQLFSFREYYTELEQRESLAKKFLIDALTQNEPMEPRRN